MNKLILLLLVFTVISCAPAGAGSPPPSAPQASQEAPMALSITSTAFAAGASIPAVYSCKGQSISPPLAWNDPPGGTKSFALIADDPDAPVGTFVHWVIYNIPASSRGLPQAVPQGAQLADGTQQGKNGAGASGYMGPCPPSGTHRYFFKLYALDSAVSLSSGAGKDDLLKAMQGHILAQGELMGTFSK